MGGSRGVLRGLVRAPSARAENASGPGAPEVCGLHFQSSDLIVGVRYQSNLRRALKLK